MLPEATVRRLPLYLRVLAGALEDHQVTIASEELAGRAGVNAAQVRKDLSYLGSYGTRGVGYDTELLRQQLSRQLGLTQDYKVALVGLGNLGQALVNYRGFSQRGFHVVATFDSDPAKVGRQFGGAAVHAMTDLDEVVAREGITMALIATPAGVAQDVADRLVAAGVTSLLNFAPTVLSVPAEVCLRQVDMAIELQVLGYYEHVRAAGGLAADGNGGARRGQAART